MRLFRLTFATILHRKAWVICGFALIVLPFVLPLISSATEKPVLIQPARILAIWNILWISALTWGLFTAAHAGENNAKSGIGEYFLTTGISASRQLFQIWLAIICFIVPLAILAALVCQFAALPKDSDERWMWWILNAQYAALFIMVIAPLLALATAIASRFGGITGFAFTLFLALYGLYGVGYLDNMLKQEENSILHGLWLYSPQYRFADLTQRLMFKDGALSASAFWMMMGYYAGISAVFAGIARLSFRTKIAT